MRKRLALLAAALGLVAVAWWFRPDNTLGHAIVTIRRVQLSVAAADDRAEHVRGLRGVTALTSNTGLLFVFGGPPSDRTFTMDGVQLSLDLVWIRDGRIVGITPNLPAAAWTAGTVYPSPQPVTFVLEVAGGTVEQHGLSVGDAVSIERTDK